MLIATKVGEDMGEGRSLKKDYILRECEASLRRLQTDHIDLYQTHFDDEVTPVEETMQAYAALIKAGKVRAIGASNISPARLKASLAASKQLGLPRYESLQPLYNLSDRKEFETEFAPICREHKLGVINYYSLAAGFLTGKYRSAEEGAKHPGRGGRLKRYLDARGLGILKVAGRRGGTAQRPAGPDRAGLADRQADHHGADRQRHQPETARRNHEGASRSSFRPRTSRRSTPREPEFRTRNFTRLPDVDGAHERTRFHRRPQTALDAPCAQPPPRDQQR